MGVGRVRTRRVAAVALLWWVALLPAPGLCSSLAVQDAVETWSSWCRYGLARCDRPTSLGPFFDEVATKLGEESRRALSEAAERLMESGVAIRDGVAGGFGAGDGGSVVRGLLATPQPDADVWGEAVDEASEAARQARTLQTALDVLVASAGLSRGLESAGDEAAETNGVGEAISASFPGGDVSREADATGAVSASLRFEGAGEPTARRLAEEEQADDNSEEKVAVVPKSEPEYVGFPSPPVSNGTPEAATSSPVENGTPAPAAPDASAVPTAAEPYSRRSLPPWLWLVFACCGSLVLFGAVAGIHVAYRRRERKKTICFDRPRTGRNVRGATEESGSVADARSAKGDSRSTASASSLPTAVPFVPHPKTTSVSSTASSSTLASSLSKPSLGGASVSSTAVGGEARTEQLGERDVALRSPMLSRFMGLSPPALSPLRVAGACGVELGGPASERASLDGVHASDGNRVVVVDVQTPPSAKKRDEDAERRRLESELVTRECGGHDAGGEEAGARMHGRLRDESTLLHNPKPDADGTPLSPLLTPPVSLASSEVPPPASRSGVRFPTVLAATVLPPSAESEAVWRGALADVMLQRKAHGESLAKRDDASEDVQASKASAASLSLLPPLPESSLLRAGVFRAPSRHQSSTNPFRHPSEEVSHGAMSAKPVLSEGSWSLGEDDAVVDQPSGVAAAALDAVTQTSALLRGASDADVMVAGIRRGPGSEQREEIVQRDDHERVRDRAFPDARSPRHESSDPALGRDARRASSHPVADLAPHALGTDASAAMPVPALPGIARARSPLHESLALTGPRSATSSPRSRLSPFSNSPAASPRELFSASAAAPLLPELEPVEVLPSVRRRDLCAVGWAVTGPGGVQGGEGPSASRRNPLFSEESEERGSVWHGDGGASAAWSAKPGKRGREAAPGPGLGGAASPQPAQPGRGCGTAKSPLSKAGTLGLRDRSGTAPLDVAASRREVAPTTAPPPRCEPESSPKRVRTDRGVRAVHMRVTVVHDSGGDVVVAASAGTGGGVSGRASAAADARGIAGRGSAAPAARVVPGRGIAGPGTPRSRLSRSSEDGEETQARVERARVAPPPRSGADPSSRSLALHEPVRSAPRRHALPCASSSRGPRFLTLPSDSDVEILDAARFSREVSLGRLLGVGGNGCVLEGRWNGRFVAVKVLHESSQRSEQGLRDVVREIETLAAVGGHPRIVTLLGACLEPPRVCLIQALAPGGSLAAAIHDREWVGRDLQEVWEESARGGMGRFPIQAKKEVEGRSQRDRGPRLLRVRRSTDAGTSGGDDAEPTPRATVLQSPPPSLAAAARISAAASTLAAASPVAAASVDAAAAPPAAAGSASTSPLSPLSLVPCPALPSISTRGATTPAGRASSLPSTPSTPGSPLVSLGCRRPEYGTLLQILRDVAEAMAHCHGLRPPVVHRDLKPPNVLLDASGCRASVADFGLAKQRGRSAHRRRERERQTEKVSIGDDEGREEEDESETRRVGGTRVESDSETPEGYASDASSSPASSESSSSSSGSTVLSILTSTTVSDAAARGTAAYMPPEAFSGSPVDERGDVWAWASLAHECLSGKEPWSECRHVLQIVMAVGVERRCPQVPLGTPPRLASLLRACWRGEPELRPTFVEILRTLDDMRAEDQARMRATWGDEKQEELEQ